jgi:hypothetical protein
MEINLEKRRADFFGLVALVSISAFGLNAAVVTLWAILRVFFSGGGGNLDGLAATLPLSLLGLLSIPSIKALQKYPKKTLITVVVGAGIWLVLYFGSLVYGTFQPGIINDVFSSLIVLMLITSSVFFVLWIAALIANIAVSKGRDWVPFFVLSLFFPLIMWIVVSVISGDPTRPKPVTGTKACPRCAELVKIEATLCKHCGTDLSKSKASPPPVKRRAPRALRQ